MYEFLLKPEKILLVRVLYITGEANQYVGGLHDNEFLNLNPKKGLGNWLGGYEVLATRRDYL